MPIQITDLTRNTEHFKEQGSEAAHVLSDEAIIELVTGVKVTMPWSSIETALSPLIEEAIRG